MRLTILQPCITKTFQLNIKLTLILLYDKFQTKISFLMFFTIDKKLLNVQSIIAQQ